MEPITLPKQPEMNELLAPEDSASGQKNSFCMRCDVQEQTMSYAACLWRQGVVGKGDINFPSDWAPCGEAARQGRCVALMMQAEEHAAERAIYFRPRRIENHPLAEPKRSWHSSAVGKVASVVRSAAAAVLRRPEVPAAPPRPRDVLDTLGGDSYADALTAAIAAETPVAPPAPAAPAPAPAPVAATMVAMPGETPLQMARRIAAARAAQAAQIH